MKTLPDKPDLYHLRRQATDLLAGLRDIRAAATLAEAQASLAEQYGFRTWTDLKVEVDRRRGGADVADPAVARQLATRFGLGDVVGGYGPCPARTRWDGAGCCGRTVAARLRALWTTCIP